NTIQDVLVRRARMMGRNACWVPGTDHASIATEAKVVAKLAAEGIKKSDLTREEFLAHAWEWTEKHGGIILQQLRKLGASCDWQRTAFTMDEARSESVIKVFVDLYNKGRIYRGVRMVNWDPAALTAISDEEVVYREQQGKLYYLRYMIEGEDGCVVVATTRPETILGDTALCVNPEDPRYAALKGKRVIVPLVGRSVPVIMDDYVDMEFGTGALKVTPAHDINDYMLGQKYNLETIDIFNDDGTINDRVGLYVGLDRFELRKLIESDLQQAGLMEKVEAYANKVGCSERTGAPIEPKLSMQWFLAMEELARPALEAVMNDTVRFVPPKFKNTYRYWMENVKDWNISRQLWWGHRIPAWYLPEGGFVVAETAEQALALAQAKNPALTMADLRQDEDVLDTWFSSWLWPLSVFDGVRNPDNADISYYYPTADLVTAPEIMFFWVARMIIAGYEYRGVEPFRNVYYTGIVRDKQGRKMSKSLGNSPDPLDLIAQYGADGVRLGMLFTSPAGNDLPYDDSLCEQGRNFGNKIWNAFRLVEGWSVDPALPQSDNNRVAIEWFDALFNRTLGEIERHFADYRISDALMSLYKLFWDDFSAWYLEMVKPPYRQPIDEATLRATREIFERLLKALHPFMPFITEELWHLMGTGRDGDSIMVARTPCACDFDGTLLAQMAVVQETVTAVRNLRKERNIPPREALRLMVVADENYHPGLDPVLIKMAGLSSIERVGGKVDGAAAFVVKTTQYFVPLEVRIDLEAERTRLTSELEYLEGFLTSVMAKLGNERFVSSAPAKVVENERAKKEDAEAKITALRERLTSLK
ncbi:MAG: valine--tRNA ligase, partial [Rikenellaceae bacterium]|nr:valine--tRNA ligase [Rikenellaceae bacterium]